MPYSLSEVNQMSREELIEAFGAVFEETPEIAMQAAEKRPFATVAQLYEAMMAGVDGMSPEDKLRLIRVHPNLGSKAKMAQDSVQEQAGIGLNRLTRQEYERFQGLNQRYKSQFGFPFIVAVKHHTKETILQAFEERLQHPPEEERENAIAQIKEIARLRLNSLIQ
jgi:2-oxo-4-hydroxy-4-carboxy-5-ureidoimidazoline decarboxylase